MSTELVAELYNAIQYALQIEEITTESVGMVKKLTINVFKEINQRTKADYHAYNLLKNYQYLLCNIAILKSDNYEATNRDNYISLIELSIEEIQYFKDILRKVKFVLNNLNNPDPKESMVILLHMAHILYIVQGNTENRNSKLISRYEKNNLLSTGITYIPAAENKSNFSDEKEETEQILSLIVFEKR